MSSISWMGSRSRAETAAMPAAAALVANDAHEWEHGVANELASRESSEGVDVRSVVRRDRDARSRFEGSSESKAGDPELELSGDDLVESSTSTVAVTESRFGEGERA